MAGSARILERMAREAGPLIEHRQVGVRASLEQRQRSVASGQLIVASNTTVCCVAGCARCAIQRGILPVDGVLPSHGV